MIILILLFIKTLKKKKNEIKKIIPNIIFNSKLFFVVLINFICMEIERVPMVLFMNFILFFYANSSKKKKMFFLN